MKIINQFEDADYFRHAFGRIVNDGEFWRWGLGDDGNIYMQSTDFIDQEEWFPITHSTNVLRIFDMKKIVKEFGHLLGFL